MELTLKPISKDGIPEAISKAELYRYLNEPGEAESICRDILAADSENQTALRLLGLSITDQFSGSPGDRYNEADVTFQSLHDQYERFYYAGILHERQAKAQADNGKLFRSAGIDAIQLRTDQPYGAALAKFFETREKRRMRG